MLNPERRPNIVFSPDNHIASLTVEPSQNIADIVETVRDEQLRQLLMRMVLEGRVEKLCAMSAFAAADEIGNKIYGMTTRKAAGLYRFVVANGLLTFEEELQGRRKIPYFTPEGLLTYVGLASEDAKGTRRGELFQKAKAALGDVLGRQLLEIPHHRTRPSKSSTLLKRSEMPLTEEIQAEAGRPAYLRRIPQLTLGQLYILAQTTPQIFTDWLNNIPGTDLDAVTVPPDIFPAAYTIMLLNAADKCVKKRDYTALKKFDPSLAEVSKKELRDGSSLAEDNFFKDHPERKNYAQLHRVLMLWFEKKAVQHIERRVDTKK